MTSLKFPYKQSVKSIRVTFIDDEQNTLHRWLDKWINEEIFNHGKYVSTLDIATKLIQIQKLNSKKEAISGQLTSYWVYPEGSLNFTGNSEATPHTISQEFIIVGEIGSTGSNIDL